MIQIVPKTERIVFSISPSDFGDPATVAMAAGIKRAIAKWLDPSVTGLLAFGFDPDTAGYLALHTIQPAQEPEPEPVIIGRDCQRVYNRARRTDAREDGVCVRCWKHKARDGKTECAQCSEGRAIARRNKPRFAA